MPQLIMKLNVNRVDLVDEGANSAAFIKMYKRKETNDIMELAEILSKMKPEHAAIINAEIAKAKADAGTDAGIDAGKCPVCNTTLVDGKCPTCEKKLTDADAAVKKANKETEEAVAKLAAKDTNDNKDDKVKDEEVMKNLDPAVQALFKKMQETADEAVNKAKALEETNITNEAIAKAKSLSALPIEEAKLVTVLKSASPEVVEILKAANKCMEDSGIFSEIGKSKDGNAEGDAWSKIEKKADELTKSERITKQSAIGRIIKENPDLYREYLNGGNA